MLRPKGSKPMAPFSGLRPRFNIIASKIVIVRPALTEKALTLQLW